MTFCESTLEDAALETFESSGYTVPHGPEIAPGELLAERGRCLDALPGSRVIGGLLPNLVSGELRVNQRERTGPRARYET